MLSALWSIYVISLLACASILHAIPGVSNPDNLPDVNLSPPFNQPNASTLSLPFTPQTKPSISVRISSYEPPWQAVPLVYLYLGAINIFWLHTSYEPIENPSRIDNPHVSGLTILVVPTPNSHSSLNTFSFGWALLGALDVIFLQNPWDGSIWDIPLFEIVANGNSNIGVIRTELFRPEDAASLTATSTAQVDESDDVRVNATYDGVPLDVKSMLHLLFEASQMFWKVRSQDIISPHAERLIRFGPTERGVSLDLIVTGRRMAGHPMATAAEIVKGLRLIIRDYLMTAKLESMHGTFVDENGVKFAGFRFLKHKKGGGSADDGGAKAAAVS